jgi:NodT family efflux transporter outer membrane factor (OMF) lipoprotein
MRSSLLLVVAALSGCASVPLLPDASKVVLPTRYTYTPEVSAQVSIATLLPSDAGFAALKKAARTAPNIEAALARIDAARALVRSATANRLPSLSVDSSIAAERGSAASQPNNPFFDRDKVLFQPKVQASWDLDIFGSLRASKRASQARLDAAGADADAVRLALDCDIAQALLDYRDAAAREAIVRGDLQDSVELVRLTRVKSRAGVVPEFDVVRAQALAKDAEARLTPFGGQKAQAVGRLVTLTALDTQSILVALEVEAKIDVPAQLLVGLPSRLLRNRPDIRAAELQLAAAKQDVAVAAAARFPRITLNGSLGLLALAAGDVFTGDALTALAGSSITGPLLDFGRVASQIDRQDALAREAFANYRGIVFQAIGDTEGNLGQLAAARKRAVTLSEKAGIDSDALSLARERYRLGLTDFITVIDAQRTLNQTRQDQSAAHWQIWRDATELYRAIGGDGNVQGN